MKPLYFVALSIAWLASSLVMAAELRYVARFSDGSRHEGNAFVNWHEINAQPQLEGRSLLDAGNHFRWLRDRTLSPAPLPSAYVELITGDQLPGNVVGYAAAGDDYDPLPPHFLVEPLCTLRPPQDPPRTTIRVIAASVKKIVWQARERAKFQPSSLLMRDGRTVAFRAVRFDDGFASVLTAEGNRKIAFNDIAEAHLPTVDFWQRYLEELAVLSPQGTARLHQLETTDGLTITGCKDRMAIHAQGGGNEPNKWFHGLQPAWALDILWVPNEKVWLRRSFAPHEVPLSRVPPVEVRHQSTLGKLGEPWQRDRNLAGEPLRSGAREWGFGFGVSTTTDLVFELPPGAKNIRGSVGLDRLAGKGGCAKVIVSCGAKDVQKLWESPALQGSDAAHDFGPLPCPAPSEKQKLILRADALHAGRPAGADPLEVRDFVDWCDPLIEFDPAVWLPQLRQKMPNALPALAEWQVDVSGVSNKPPPKFESFVDKRAPQPGRFRTGVILEQPLVVTRKFAPSPRDQWLVVHVTRPLNQGNEPRVEARIEGELVGEFKVPLNEGHIRPLAVPLIGYQGSKKPEIDVKLTLFSEPSSGPVEWRSLRTAEQLPTLYRVFEEENRFEAVEGPAPTLDTGDGRFGVQALKLAAGSVARIKFDRPLRIRDNPNWGEYRQLRFSLRKKGKGSVLVELEGNGDRQRVLRYGKMQDPPRDYVKAHDRPLTDEWVFDFTRDLIGDFGAFDLEAITIRIPDGEYALLDHVYLAGQWDDLNLITKTPSLEVVNRKRDQAIADDLIKRAKPATVLIDFGEERIGNGVITNYTGEILTAGHLVLAPNREVKITLADGKEVKGKTRGLSRDLDIGLIVIEPAGGYPQMGVNNWMELGTQQLCVAAAHRKGAKPDALEGAAADLRRIFKGTAWTTFEIPNGMTGGPLVEQNGQLVGILTRYSPFGGAEYGLTLKLNEVEGRLRNGEVWGKWRAGAGPDFGFTADSNREGAKIVTLDPAGPAAKAGVQKGDLIVKADGQDTRGIEDLYNILAERDAGHEAAFDLVRNGQPVSVRIKLAPRTP
jgi:S1-C subfamily serine protease